MSDLSRYSQCFRQNNSYQNLQTGEFSLGYYRGTEVYASTRCWRLNREGGKAYSKCITMTWNFRSVGFIWQKLQMKSDASQISFYEGSPNRWEISEAVCFSRFTGFIWARTSELGLSSLPYYNKKSQEGSFFPAETEESSPAILTVPLQREHSDHKTLQ